MEPIVLASGSPRRQEYFRLLGLPFSVEPAMIDEEFRETDEPRKIAEDLALKKALHVAGRMQAQKPLWVFGADTIVVADSGIFGKPTDRGDAKQMLQRLAGREHEVISAMALWKGREQKANCRSADCRSTSCRVTFAPMSGPEIEWYLDSEEWQGAAGAYRLQGLAACFISRVTGAPSTVVGLPLRDFYVMLRDNGYPFGA
ncbi:MAG: Maf family protein [Treponema sp.]|jgi:septum formation protein|nr:Maf family protein [Treponema sp.]